jgi:hypothetical protein
MPSQEKPPESNHEWIKAELSSVSLGDQRLNWRLQDTAEKLASRPSGSINQACDDWADTKATYRLFDNQKTTAEKVLLPHQARTKLRIVGQKTVLAVQDTTYLDYSHHPGKTGMGPIGTEKQNLRGLVMHSTLALTTAGLPLGIVSQSLWARAAEPKPMTPDAPSGHPRKVPIAEKESYKWLAALDETVKYIPAGTQCVSVGDSESDIFELFDHARTLHTDLLVRAAQDRAVCAPEVGRLWHCLEQRTLAGHLKVSVPKRNKLPEREAIVAVRFAKITLKAPAHLRSRLPDCPLFAVLVAEENPPSAVEPLCWLLLTTVPVRSFADAQERIQWYCHRWKIEVYHKILKSGCQVEKAQLATAERLRPMLALFCIIAWRLFWLTYLARHEPDAPCTAFLTDAEWRALYAFIHKTDARPSAIPTVHQATRWIAKLGGFLDRKNDGNPGVTVFWRGWQRLADISSAWLIFHPT